MRRKKKCASVKKQKSDCNALAMATEDREKKRALKQLPYTTLLTIRDPAAHGLGLLSAFKVPLASSAAFTSLRVFVEETSRHSQELNKDIVCMRVLYVCVFVCVCVCVCVF